MNRSVKVEQIFKHPHKKNRVAHTKVKKGENK